jgi:hypothetical protein
VTTKKKRKKLIVNVLRFFISSVWWKNW